MLAPITFTPIGLVHSPFVDRQSAPRQATAPGALEVTGTIELFSGHGFEHALEDLEGWDRIWVIFAFHLNPPGSWRPKVLPPRSTEKRGVFATRSPHRPNPIGMSVVRLDAVSGLTLTVRDLDLLDGTPVLDLKPYVPYADAFPVSRTGWLESQTIAAPADPVLDAEPGFVVTWSPVAAAHAAWLRGEHGVDLRTAVDQVLSLGPQPHPYRRIKPDGDAFRLAVKDWRVRFRVTGRQVLVERVMSGYRASELASSELPAVAVQRAFVARFPVIEL